MRFKESRITEKKQIRLTTLETKRKEKKTKRKRRKDKSRPISQVDFANIIRRIILKVFATKGNSAKEKESIRNLKITKSDKLCREEDFRLP